MKEGKFNDWWKYMLGIIGTILVFQLQVFNSNISTLTDEVKALVVTTTINTQKIDSHETASSEWKDRIEALENGSVRATQDRITKTEVLAMLDKQKEWVEAYYQRK